MVSAATSKHATGAGACAQCGDLVRAQWSILYRATLVARCVCPCLSGLQLVRFRSVGAARMVSTSNSKHKTGAGACAQFGERPRAQRSILYRATPWSHGVVRPCLWGLQLVRFWSVGATREVSTAGSMYVAGVGACAECGERPRAQRSIL